ncbi:hypothetical protein [Rummeliibacillus sp. SL167]|uniref:hypothetical protein n=1 Tax=Rummeliibacillus sp. SL167 TaxID=2579792 RepID=UPI0011B4F04A|nr:hypothetical protein [Rummeliibacillus sp. SL167]
MNKLFSLEISNTNNGLGLLEGDGVIVSTIEQPQGNGKDLAVFEVAGQRFVSTFTRFGNQIMLLGEKYKLRGNIE